MAKEKKPKVEQTEIPMEGRGVAQVKDRKLDALAEQFEELTDSEKETKSSKKLCELEILERMAEINLVFYRIGDRVLELAAGKTRVKIKKRKKPANLELDK